MTIIGWVAAIVLIIFGMVTSTDPSGNMLFEFGNVTRFYDLASVMIVVGGVIAALMAAFPLKYFTAIPKHLKIVLFPTKYNPVDYVNQLVDFAKEARINGLLALESKLEEVKDDFMKSSLLMVVDAVDADKVKSFLEEKMNYLEDRHGQAFGFYEKAANFAPAFGMIGTLIGLVNLLQQMDDPSSIGGAMGVALITTFYGTVLANVIFNPIATKLRARHEEEMLCKMIICEGVQAIQSGDNPKFIHEKLLQLLPNSIASKQVIEGEGDSGSGGGGKEKKEKKDKKAK